MNFPVEEGVYHVLTAIGVPNIHFFLAAIPVQLILFFFYLSRRQLPLRESRSFLVLMGWNMVILLTDLLLVYTGSMGREEELPFRPLFFFCSVLMEDYFLFYYFCDALQADDYGGKRIRWIAFLPVAAGILYFVEYSMTGANPAELALLFREINLVYLAFFAGLSLILVWLRRKSNSFRRNMGFAFCLLVLLFGLLGRLLFPQVLFAGYFFTLASFILYLTVRNPDFYLEHQTKVLNKAAFHLVAQDRIRSCGIHGFGFVIKDYEEGRILYGSAFIDSFLESIGRFLIKEFSGGDAFYLGSGRFFLLFRRKIDGPEETDRLHRRFRKAWTKGERSAFFDICCCSLEEGLLFPSVEELMEVITFAFDVAEGVGQEDFIIGRDYQAKVAEQVQVRRLLMDSLEQDSLLVYLQPLMNGQTGKLEGAEALVRLSDGKGGLVPPGEFIPAAESSGSVATLGLQVFKKVCAFIRKGGMDRCGMKWINVNVSPVQCLDRKLPEKLESIRKLYDVSPALLHLEITEQGALGPGGLEQIRRLRKLGYHMVLDDYGTGHANASRVKNIPLSGIKIDMSLVRAHFRKPDPYLPGLINGLHDLGFTVTAEGVETEDMVKELRAMGCDYFQGFYYSRPISMEEFLEKYGTK
ncbi:EAL domain-containing protein [uncultured Dialister sp.]|uniref:EAL domain-containing protein n=1 Tax=uncultured Dialister sp. TaxID=278064 RepID=UPI002604C0A0|nr:EAL domain-containing protein [uncultured Dialister sp.]